MSRILFVNAPFGFFFRDLAREIEKNGGVVFRIVADGGEYLYTPKRNRVRFDGGAQAWDIFIEQTISTYAIDTIVTFNDCLRRARDALEIAKKMHVARFVLENGYIRPFWVTLDRNGVNGHSPLPQDPALYLQQAQPEPEHEVFDCRERAHVANTIGYYMAAVSLWPFMSFDASQFGVSMWKQGVFYAKEWLWRQMHDDWRALGAMDEARRRDRRIFACLLQKSGDAQLVVHSKYGGNDRFVEDVLQSFARHAPPDSLLVIKQHPLDYVSSQGRATACARRAGVEDRVIYLRNTEIDAVFERVDGIVTVNSTAGLTAVVRGLPTVALGVALYDMPDMTFQSGLDAFWTEATPPNRALVLAFVSYLKRTSQINGGFHTRQARRILVPRLAAALALSGERQAVATSVAPAHAEAGARAEAILAPSGAVG